jgi:hypothetical protein
MHRNILMFGLLCFATGLAARDVVAGEPFSILWLIVLGILAIGWGITASPFAFRSVVGPGSKRT